MLLVLVSLSKNQSKAENLHPTISTGITLMDMIVVEEEQLFPANSISMLKTTKTKKKLWRFLKDFSIRTVKEQKTWLWWKTARVVLVLGK